VVSPHLDDAVLSCGQRLAAAPGSTVITVFTEGPAAGGSPTAWDASCGFRAGDDVMAARRAEDEAALGWLHATPVWLGLLEAQYGGSLDVGHLAGPLAAALGGWEGIDVVVPLGLHHPAHVAVAAAARAVMAGRPDLRWWAYADQPYAALHPDTLETRLAELGLGEPEPPPAADVRYKRAALREYRTQLRALAGSWRLSLAPERAWRLTMDG